VKINKAWNGPSASVSTAPRHQVCPHGSSFPCSQCIGAEVVHKITRDEKTGALLMDGKVVRSGLIPEAELKMIRDELSSKMIRTHEGGRRETSCGICGKAGHTRKTCSGRSKLISAPHTEKDEKPEQHRTRAVRCSNCGEVGHYIRTCPVPDKIAA